MNLSAMIPLLYATVMQPGSSDLPISAVQHYAPYMHLTRRYRPTSFKSNTTSNFLFMMCAAYALAPETFAQPRKRAAQRRTRSPCRSPTPEADDDGAQGTPDACFQSGCGATSASELIL